MILFDSFKFSSFWNMYFDEMVFRIFFIRLVWVNVFGILIKKLYKKKIISYDNYRYYIKLSGNLGILYI